MPTYTLPVLASRPATTPKTAWLIASGDLREAANLTGWPVQQQLEADLSRVLGDLGWSIVRAHPADPGTGHGFISTQRMGLEVFRGIPVDAPLIVAESVWQYSHHVLGGLRTHGGPILTVANFDGGAPGLVGVLGLNAGLTKMGVAYSSLWSVDFRDEWFLTRLREWTENGTVQHDTSHVRPLPALDASPETELGDAIAASLIHDKTVFAVFDEGCMGMYNAIIDDELMNPLGVYKERLSQSALWAEMLAIPDAEAQQVLDWLLEQGMTFRFGEDDATELTRAQVLSQAKMYIALLRIADDYGAEVIGIQYQQGLAAICPASDLAEGLINNADRPPVRSRDGSRVLWDGLAVPLANEADEGVAVDALVTNRVWSAMGLDPATTLHDVRWGEEYEGTFVWVLEISGSVPASHLEGGYRGAEGWRQNPMYFPLGGSTLRGVSRAGDIVWSRLYIADGRLQLDIGVGSAVELPRAETERRWAATNPEWPIMHGVFPGVTRDQFMARHKANHVQVAYAPDAETARRALIAKAAAFRALGVEVHLAGDVPGL